MRIWHSESVRGLFLTLLCLFCVTYPLFAGPGPVNTRGGGDSPFLFVRLEQLVAGLRAGAFPVRWMPDAAYGLGYPFFNFYAALPYYIAAGLRALGWGPISSLQATQALGFLLAALTMGLLARRVYQHPAAVSLAAVAYTCAPFHLVNVYVRGDSLSEFYAFVFYPLIFWALHCLCAQPTALNVAWLALSYGGLILTHNLSAIMYSPFVALYAVFLLVSRRADRRIPWRTAARMVGGGMLGVALAATLWLTAVSDLDAVWMGHREIQTTGFFNYAAQFRGNNLVQLRPTFDYEIADRTPFAMGLIQAVLIGLGAVVLFVGWLRAHLPKRSTRTADPQEHSRTVRRGTAPEDHSHPVIRRECPSLHSPTTFWIGGLLLSTFLITPLSRLLWDHLPLLPIVQFPWRFLSVQAFFGALIVGALAERLPRPWWVAAIGTAILLAATLGDLRPEYLPIDNADVTPERLATFELFTTNIGTTIRGEYLPVEVEPRPYASRVTLNGGRRPAPVALSGQIERAHFVGRDARSERWEVTVLSESARLALYTLYFPGWRAWIDGLPAEIEPLSGSGLIAIDVPEGTHVVDLLFGRTTVRWIADLLSLAAGLGIAVLLWPTIRTVGTVPWKHVSTAISTGIILLGVLVLVGGLLSVPRGTPRGDDLTMDFDRMPFLHHNPNGIDLGGRARLDAYAYEGRVGAGDVLTVTLHWGQRDTDLLARVSLVPPSNQHPDLRPPPSPLAQASAHIEGSRTVHALVVPPDAASGVYYLTLRAFDDEDEVRAIGARGYALGTTYLRPVWIDNPRPAGEDEPVLARFGDRVLLRDDVQVSADDAGWEVVLTWQATRPIPTNYAYSLRVLTADGTVLAQRDLEGGPGYGFWPTSAWRAGEWLTDRVRLSLPAGARAQDAAAVNVILYDRARPDAPGSGSVIVPLVEREHTLAPPPMEHPVGAQYGDQVELLGYDLIQDARALRVTLHWRALRPMSTDWAVFVHLFDPQTEEIATQWDAEPLLGAYPTTWWRRGEVVSDEVVLSLADVPGGSYALGVGLYDATSATRLPVETATGEMVPGGRLVLAHSISIEK